MKRSKLPVRWLLIVFFIIVAVGAWYTQTRRHAEVQNPGTFVPTTPEARNAVRLKSLQALATAMHDSYRAHGKYPFSIPRLETAICNGSSAHCKQVRLLDVTQLLSDGTIAAIPNDPIGGTGQYNSGFSLRREADGSITLRAPRTEGVEILSVKL